MMQLIPKGRKCTGCPYWTFKKRHNIPMPYCDYLNNWGLPNDLTFRDRDFLLSLYGKDFIPEFPLAKLSDKLKECDLNL